MEHGGHLSLTQQRFLESLHGGKMGFLEASELVWCQLVNPTTFQGHTGTGTQLHITFTVQSCKM